MFSKKLHVDVKKSTLKIQDVKKDSATRFKHLKIVLGEVRDGDGAPADGSWFRWTLSQDNSWKGDREPRR